MVKACVVVVRNSNVVGYDEELHYVQVRHEPFAASL